MLQMATSIEVKYYLFPFLSNTQECEIIEAILHLCR